MVPEPWCMATSSVFALYVGHPENYSFILLTFIFVVSKYPRFLFLCSKIKSLETDTRDCITQYTDEPRLLVEAGRT